MSSFAAGTGQGGAYIPNVRLSFLTAADQVKFEQLFRSAAGSEQALSGDKAKDILLRSRLPAPALSKIWALSDTTRSGQLLFPEFALAMYLCNMQLNGRPVPDFLPETIANEVSSLVDIISFGIPDNQLPSAQPASAPLPPRLAANAPNFSSPSNLDVLSGMQQQQQQQPNFALPFSPAQTGTPLVSGSYNGLNQSSTGYVQPPSVADPSSWFRLQQESTGSEMQPQTRLMQQQTGMPQGYQQQPGMQTAMQTGMQTGMQSGMQTGMQQAGLPQSGMNTGLQQPGLRHGMQQPDLQQPNRQQPTLQQPNLQQQNLQQPSLQQSGLPKQGLQQFGYQQPDRPQLGMQQTGMQQSGLQQAGLQQFGLQQPGLQQTDMQQRGMQQPGTQGPSVPMQQPTAMQQPSLMQQQTGIQQPSGLMQQVTGMRQPFGLMQQQTGMQQQPKSAEGSSAQSAPFSPYFSQSTGGTLGKSTYVPTSYQTTGTSHLQFSASDSASQPQQRPQQLHTQQPPQYQPSLPNSSAYAAPQNKMLPQYTGASGQFGFTPTQGALNLSGIEALSERLMPQAGQGDSADLSALRGSSVISWAITKEEKRVYDQIFTAWDRLGKGYIGGETALQIFGQTGLPREDLERVWYAIACYLDLFNMARTLSDPSNKGNLDKDEFAVALHLVYRRLNGYDIPVRLPPELVPPSSRALSNSVNSLKNMIRADAVSHPPSSAIQNAPGTTFLKSRSFKADTFDRSRKDAVSYKHNDDEIGYKSTSRRMQDPSKPIERVPEENAQAKEVTRLEKDIHEKQIVLEVLKDRSKEILQQAEQRQKEQTSSTDELYRKIRHVQDEIDNDPATHRTKNSAIDKQSIKGELQECMNRLPDLVRQIRETEKAVVSAKIQIHGREQVLSPVAVLLGSGQDGTLTDTDCQKVRAAIFIQSRLSFLLGKPVSDPVSELIGSDDWYKDQLWSEDKKNEQAIKEIAQRARNLHAKAIRLI